METVSSVRFTASRDQGSSTQRGPTLAPSPGTPGGISASGRVALNLSVSMWALSGLTLRIR